MAKVTRAAREAAADRASEERNPQRKRLRVLLTEAEALASADRKARYPGGLTAENVEEAVRYQEERLAHHKARLGVTDEAWGR